LNNEISDRPLNGPVHTGNPDYETPRGISSALSLEKGEIRSLIGPYILDEYTTDSPAWNSHIHTVCRNLRRQFFKNRLKRLVFGSLKSVRRVKGGYGQVWALDMYPGTPTVDESVHWLRWEQQGFRVKGWAEKRIHLLLLMKIIHALKPARVLEVGSGNGAMSMMLSTLCPGVEFNGIELTETGVQMARKIQLLDTLPAGMLQFLPAPPLNPAGFRQVNFQVGNAKNLPFPPNSIDLVFSSLALEQMKAVQAEVLSEMSRVSTDHVFMIEPFPDFNKTKEQRYYTIANEYFSVPVSGLTNHGLTPASVFSDFPSKIYRGVGAVLAKPIQ
jgi:ubiquinone/menaquinone biosynthesis C-methylase UbiE